jgi:hypothetical protein
MPKYPNRRVCGEATMALLKERLGDEGFREMQKRRGQLGGRPKKYLEGGLDYSSKGDSGFKVTEKSRR